MNAPRLSDTVRELFETHVLVERKKLKDLGEQLDQEVDALYDALEWAWSVIANAGGGDWTRESAEWQEAAAKWRDSTMPEVSRYAASRAAPQGEP